VNAEVGNRNAEKNRTSGNTASPIFPTSGFPIPSSDVVAVFARAPERGLVKTRLAATHGDDFALELYRAMLLDTLALCTASGIETHLWISPDEADAGSFWNGPVHGQGEGDLWTRLLRADTALRVAGFERVMVIGADSPDLPAAFLREAFAALEGHSTVVGPSTDGGFYLLGSSNCLPDELFVGVPISTRETFACLRRNLPSYYATLAAWRDVDDAADLSLFLERLWENLASAPRCRAVLTQHGLL